MSQSEAGRPPGRLVAPHLEDSVNVAEEVRHPAKSYPIALLGGLVAAAVIYTLVTMTASAVVPTQQLADSDGPLLEVVRQGPLGVPTTLFSAIALFALFNGALINMIMASRLVYGMAEETTSARPRCCRSWGRWSASGCSRSTPVASTCAPASCWPSGWCCGSSTGRLGGGAGGELDATKLAD